MLHVDRASSRDLQGLKFQKSRTKVADAGHVTVATTPLLMSKKSLISFLHSSPRRANAARAVIAPEVHGGHETILLVEDETSLRRLTKLALQRCGYRVLEAASGAEALTVWEQNKSPIDLLLTDMVMPEGLTGRELAKQLRAHQPALKVIYVSGYSLDSEGTTFRRRDASAFLQKPYHPKSLVKAVRECLDY